MAIRSKCACTRVRRAARVLTSLYDEALAATGLNIAQFALLRAVGRLGTPNLSELAEEMALDRSTLGRNVLVLKRMRLLDVAEGDDLRARRVTTTTRAQRVVDSCLPMWDQAQRKVEARLGKEGGNKPTSSGTSSGADVRTKSLNRAQSNATPGSDLRVGASLGVGRDAEREGWELRLTRLRECSRSV